jgi:hypothetical protein
MGITGNLRTMALSELLQWLSMGLKTGTLVIEGHGVEKRIFFQDGRVSSSSSSEQREYLGHFLVSHGYITEEELKMAMEVQEESSILLGKILVMINAVSETDLLRLMRKKAEESIYEVFMWEEGGFEFLDNELPEQKMVPLSLDVTGIIMEGLRRLDEWRRIREKIPKLSLVPRIVQPLDFARLSEQEKLVVPFINGIRSIDEIAIQTHNSEFVVTKLIFDGLRTNAIELQEPPETAPEASVAEGLGGDIDNFLRRGRSVMAESPETAWRLFKAATELDPNDVRPREALKEAEASLRAGLSRDGIDPQKVPVLKITPEQSLKLNFNPNEAFVLSRINSAWDVKSILKISPIKEIEVLLIFKRFYAEGIIEWKAKKEKEPRP